MSIIERVEKSFSKKIPCTLKDDDGNIWAVHGIILSAYNKGYNDGKEDLAIKIKANIEKDINPNDNVVIIKKNFI